MAILRQRITKLTSLLDFKGAETLSAFLTAPRTAVTARACSANAALATPDSADSSTEDPAAALSSKRAFGQAERRKVGVAISGGVDSAVAALLLKQQGHDVFGIFMQNWDEVEEADSLVCSEEKDLCAAERVCQQLGISLHTANFVRSYWNDVFLDFLEKYGRGLTPNPDLLCNRNIKFDALLSCARALGAEKIATGHYARLQTAEDGSKLLLRGADHEKDQSYFLASVRPGAFSDVLFPLGGLTKLQVRLLAQDAGLHNAFRKSSAGVCFIGKRRFGDFLAQYTEPLPGKYVDVDTGADLGLCANLAAVTYGQRAGIGGAHDRIFVVGKDVPNRIVFVGAGPSHLALFSHTAVLREPHWLSGRPPAELASGKSLRCTYKARYRQNNEACMVTNCRGACSSAKSDFTALLPEDIPGDDQPGLKVWIPAAARAITPQQEFVLYDGDVCLGSAAVLYPGKSLAEEACSESRERHLHDRLTAVGGDSTAKRVGEEG